PAGAPESVAGVVAERARSPHDWPPPTRSRALAPEVAAQADKKGTAASVSSRRWCGPPSDRYRRYPREPVRLAMKRSLLRDWCRHAYPRGFVRSTEEKRRRSEERKRAFHADPMVRDVKARGVTPCIS